MFVVFLFDGTEQPWKRVFEFEYLIPCNINASVLWIIFPTLCLVNDEKYTKTVLQSCCCTHVLVFCFFLSLVTAIYPIILSAHQLSTKGAHLSIRKCLTFSCVITFLAIFPSHLWLGWKSFPILPRKACCDMVQSLILVSTNATDQDLDLFTTSMCLCGLCIQLRATQCNNYSTSAAPSSDTLECL